MKLHSDTLTRRDVYEAALHAARCTSDGEVWIGHLETSGSRSRQRALTVLLEGDGSVKRRRNMYNTGFAATYDQWGHFLAYLFAADPRLRTTDYDGAADFHTKTKDAFHLSEAQVSH